MVYFRFVNTIVHRQSFWIGFLLAVLELTTAQGAELEAQRDGVIEAASYVTPDFSGDQNTNPAWQTEIEKLGSLYVRLRISADGVTPVEAVLRIRDRSGRLVREYTASDLLSRGSFWSAVVPGDYALVSLHASGSLQGFRLAIDQIAYQAHGGAPLSTVGIDEKEPIANYADDAVIARIERPVARLLFVEGGIPRTCTGFLIDTGELMTNNHCVNSQAACESALAIFGYQHDRGGLLHFGEQFECAKFQEERSSVELDYAALQLRGNPATIWGTLSLSGTDPAPTSGIFIVQHPAGEPKKISKKGCLVSAVPVDGRASETDFAHSCDTVGGSSGSPMFNASGDVIGLHHYGFGEGGDWSENRAIRMKRIVDELSHR
ncbi:serine protease [Sinorhizobium medicae]|uniref:trypsin-like serine peptidase n=1 Tax=Sinorhizobium medicae TaxID=110321 RepID=UPI000FD77797|nr:serine protease [Sinorhizobium medicae]RVJ45888.1 serine protease [Sinorhizobium medicae]